MARSARVPAAEWAPRLFARLRGAGRRRAPARPPCHIRTLPAAEPGLTSAQKKDKLSRMSYRDYLKNIAKVSDKTLAFYQTITHDEYGSGIDADMTGVHQKVTRPGVCDGDRHTECGLRVDHAREVDPEVLEDILGQAIATETRGGAVPVAVRDNSHELHGERDDRLAAVLLCRRVESDETVDKSLNNDPLLCRTVAVSRHDEFDRGGRVDGLDGNLFGHSQADLGIVPTVVERVCRECQSRHESAGNRDDRELG